MIAVFTRIFAWPAEAVIAAAVERRDTAQKAYAEATLTFLGYDG